MCVSSPAPAFLCDHCVHAGSEPGQPPRAQAPDGLGEETPGMQSNQWLLVHRPACKGMEAVDFHSCSDLERCGFSLPTAVFHCLISHFLTVSGFGTGW